MCMYIYIYIHKTPHLKHSGGVALGLRGVRVTQEADKWGAEIKREGRQIRLGLFDSQVYICAYVCVCVCIYIYIS